MYEGKPKKSLNINWKSLLIKMAILLAVIFIILWVVSLFKKDNKNVESNLSTNLQTMKSAATEYFTGSRLPSNVNGKKKITLREMFDKKLVVEFRDQNNKSCDLIDSYAEATKLNDTDYTIKVKLVCGSESDYVINTVSFASEKPETPVDNNQDTNNTTDDNKTTEDSNNSTSTSTSTNKKPTTSTNTNKKPSTSTNKKPTTSTSNSNIHYVTTTKPNNNTTLTNNCTYGDKEYTSTYPVAYMIPGSCAVSKNDFYKAEYANKVSSLSATEYQKLVNETEALKTKTGTSLYVESPSYSGVYNKNNAGLVGYQILFTVKQKVNYATYTIYQYYLDANGNRKAVIDKRNSLTTTNNNSSNNNTSTVVHVRGVKLNANSVSLNVGDTYYVTAIVSPSNATNKNVIWQSTNTSVASVNTAGKITARREGTATIIATIDGVSANIVVTVNDGKKYNYCSTHKERVYSTGYIDLNTLKTYNNKTINYDVVLNTKYYKNVYDVEYGHLTTTNEYIDAYNYLVNKNKPLRLANSVSSSGTSVGIDPGNGYVLKDHSLPNENYVPQVRYTGRSNNNLFFNISATYKNVNYIYNRVPYYTSKNYGVFFIPVYFDVITVDKNDCETISSSEITKYENKGYVRY